MPGQRTPTAGGVMQPIGPSPFLPQPAATGPSGPTGGYGLNTTNPGAAPVVTQQAPSPTPFGQMPNQGTPRDPSKSTQVQIDPSILNSMQGYQNAAYENQTARLDPQWQQAQNQFDQQMVAQGLQPGSQAYDNAHTQFMAGKNDAYSGAFNNSFQTGLAAQGQAFNQGYDNSQLANALKIANMQRSATLGAAATNANASMHNSDAANNTNQMLGLGNLGLGYGNLQNQTNSTDFGIYSGLQGLQNGNTQYNNSLIGGAQNTLMGLIPNSNPSPVDVTGAYGLNQSGQNAQYQGQVASANGTNQMVGSLASVAVMAMMM